MIYDLSLSPESVTVQKVSACKQSDQTEGSFNLTFSALFPFRFVPITNYAIKTTRLAHSIHKVVIELDAAYPHFRSCMTIVHTSPSIRISCSQFSSKSALQKNTPHSLTRPTVLQSSPQNSRYQSGLQKGRGCSP